MAVGCAADVVADSPSLPALVVCAVQSPGGAPAPRFCRHSPGVAPVHRHWTLVLAEASLCLLLLNENCTEHYHIPHTLSLDAVKRKKKQIYIAPLLTYLTLKALRYGSHSVTCKLHRTCLYLVSVHQMAHPRLRLRASNCSLLLIYLPRKDERPGLSAIECNPGQVVNIHVPLSPSSIIWYQPTGLAAGKVTVGLVSHWPCVTDNSGITTYAYWPGWLVT